MRGASGEECLADLPTALTVSQPVPSTFTLGGALKQHFDGFFLVPLVVNKRGAKNRMVYALTKGLSN